MPPLVALHLATRIAPLERGDDAEMATALSRALVQAGERVVVVTRRPGDLSDRELERIGLARRLDPLQVNGANLTVREGQVAGGAAPIFVLEGKGIEDDELLAAAALELCDRRGLWPDLIRAWDEAPQISAHAGRRAPPEGRVSPASVLLLRDPGSRPVSPRLEAALAAAHRIALPSASYADELLERGEGELIELLRAAPDRVRGIPAGIDEARWNPARDPHLPDRADRASIKRELRRDLGLTSSGSPLACVLGDIELLDRDAGEALAHAGAQLVFLHDPGARPGSEQVAIDLAHDHPMRVRSLKSDPALLHRAVAAADVALYCHRFTPRGFSPLFAMPYGTVPVAPRSGAFADAVVDWDPETETGSGFLFAPHRPEEIPSALRRAVRAASSGEAWSRLVARVAGTDVSWRTAGLRHAELGREAVRAARRAS
jgi:glycosyltransferase involved in cell wall biosynthesis